MKSKEAFRILNILKRWVVLCGTPDELFPYEIKVKQQYVSTRSCLVLTETEFRTLKRWLDNEK